jgi:isochorismate synthase
VSTPVVTRPLAEFTDEPVDLTALAGSDGVLFERDGVGLAGRGVAARVPADRIREWLAACRIDDSVRRPGSGPVALGAVPFVATEALDFVVPRTTVVRAADGATWVTVVSPDDGPPDLSPRVAPATSAGAFEVRPGVDVAVYLDAVAAARDAVRAGTIEKAVIARDVVVTADNPIDVHALLRRLRTSFGSSHRYSLDGLVGASPELLVEILDGDVASHPLAGTTARTGDPATDADLAARLLASAKNQLEHRIVIDMVHDTLLEHCSYLDWEPEPSIVPVANVQHLGTRIAGRLSEPFLHVLDAVYALTPTPALGGHPRDAALELIARVEGMRRGRYGGSIGWTDARGNGTWAVTIRCAEIAGTSARLFAGGGIVADSEPESELAETQAKLQAMLAAIVRP